MSVVDTMGGPAIAAPTVGSAAPLLAVNGLRHAFSGRSVLADLSFQVERGELFGLLGPNGCGKSTTLRVLTGLLVPDGGELVFDGQAVEPGARPLRQRMGVVFQAPSLDPRLTSRENLKLSASLYGIVGTEADRRVAEVLGLADLSQRATDPTGELSGGMKRRLELARALMHDPELLIMDEPTTGLDESAFRKTWERILELRRTRRLTVLFSTHRAEEAQLCDRVAIVDRGAIIAEGDPEALRQRVSGDILTLEASEPEQLAAQIEQRFSLAARVLKGAVVIEREQGHELIPRLVEALPTGRIKSLSMHRPTLADVFVKLTGRSLGDAGPEQPADGEEAGGAPGHG
ncbi:MAG: ABC transporter ATP-binding protein [Myxococcales bacterium]|nr:ABC transporter ATP-binding protein [Myxococcales bacterium]